jgi:polyhydroxybutyrate depolymerase
MTIHSPAIKFEPMFRQVTIAVLLVFALFHGAVVYARAAGNREHLQNASMSIDGVRRTYVYSVPASVRGRDNVPLVLVFHGHFGTGPSMERMSHFSATAEEKGFIAVFPNGIQRGWNDGRGLSSADDVAFTKALIAEFERHYRVDPKRIYAAGLSNGGFFSERLACELSDRIAAVAAVAALMSDALEPVCKPSRPVSILYIQGTKDPIVPIGGGPIGAQRGTAISLEDSVRFWRTRNHTQGAAAVTDLPQRTPDGTNVKRTAYGGGDQGSEVVEYVIENGGHSWPNGPQYLPAALVGKVTHQIDGSEVIWEFFSRHKRD